MPSLAVIVPFYQKQAGILRGAVESVFAQRVGPDVRVEVVIIDDESPIRPRADIEGLVAPAGFSVRIIERPNGGPGAARNTGLDSLPETTDFVGFLDSDDRWTDDHLASAIAILGDDGDFTFCDHSRWYDEKTWFQSSERIREWMAEGDRWTADPAEPTTFTFLPGQAFRSLIEDYLAHTSTVVYRFSRHRSLRFDRKLRFAGEDTMFWLDLAHASRVVRFSAVPHSHCGRGDNMYFASIDWDHPDAARRIGSVLILFIHINRKFKLEGAARDAARERLKNLKNTFAHVWLRKLAKFGVADWPALKAVMREDPGILWDIAQAGRAQAWQRIVSKAA